MFKLVQLAQSLGLKKTLLYSYNYFTYFLVKYILRKNISPRNILGSKMYLDLEHGGISKSLWLTSIREVLDVELVKKELKAGMNVIEIGANMGYYLLLESKIIGSEGTIYAFEPDPRNNKMLKINIQNNNLTNMVKSFPYAVSNEESERTFYLAARTNLNTMVEENKDTTESIVVKTVALDNFDEITKPIHFIRMDIEGFEYEAVLGMMNRLSSSRSVKILLEVHPQFYSEERDFTKIIKQLFDIGFTAKYIISAGHHTPPEFTDLGYKPIKIVHEAKHSHGLYSNVKLEDLISLIKNKTNVVRSLMLEKHE